MNLAPGAAAVGLLLLLFGGDLLAVWRPAGSETSADPSPSLAELSVGGKAFPGLPVQGASYPIPAVKAAVAQMVFIAQLALIAVMLLGRSIFAALGVPVPTLYEQWEDKKMAVIMAAWFLGNMLHNSLTSTGAFEVFYDGQQVFSKLQSGRMPSIDELMRALAAAQGHRPGP